jgi:hypothetical protein
LVTNCNDDGLGSFRVAADNSSPGDVIDLTHLPCSTITLTSGAIAIGDVTVNGPGASALTIDGNSESQVLHHYGNGTLYLDQLTVTNGKYNSASQGLGGCIFSAGSVVLNAITVSNCHLDATGGYAFGGAIFATSSVVLIDSTVTGSSATSSALRAYGGGVFAQSSLYAYYSTISDNNADGGPAGLGFGGGAMAWHSAVVSQSTISGNHAQASAGLSAATFGDGVTVLFNATISGNLASQSSYGAGVSSNSPTAIYNSTITGNMETNPADHAYGAGLALGQNAPAYLMSSVIAGNAIITPAGVFPSDINGLTGAHLTGSNNLIELSALATPADTIVADPKLGPLANNGGFTATHALLSTSPAIDAGINPNGFQFDQRGSGFQRTFGTATDIGAFENEGGLDDLIFLNGFELPL